MNIFNEDSEQQKYRKQQRARLSDQGSRPQRRAIPRLDAQAKGIPTAEPDTVKSKINRRINVISVLIVAVFALVYVRTAYLQLYTSSTLQEVASRQSERILTIPAPRGNIFDVNGIPIVSSRYAQVVSVVTADLPHKEKEKEERTRIIYDLARVLRKSPEDIQKVIDSNAYTAHDRRPIAVDVNPDIVFWLHTNGPTRFPGVYADKQIMREYPFSSLGAHVIGYTGEISQEKLDDGNHDNYKSGDQIGLSGVERTWEKALHGKDGTRQVAVNARGEVISNVAITKQPVQGSNVFLTLDAKVQLVTERALEQGIFYARTVRDSESGPGRGGTYKAPAGAVVVLEAETGAITAMASYPSYNPEAFVGGISTAEWEQLQNPNSHKPMINRAIQAGYPPGSVYKIVTSAAALQHGYAQPDSYIPCPAKWEWNESVYRNWRKSDAGSLNIAESLEQSCDTVFYELARRMFFTETNTTLGKEYIAFSKTKPKDDVQLEDIPLPNEILPTMSRNFGMGEKSGIDLPGEIAGVVPGRAWRMKYWLSAKDNYCERQKTAEPGSYAKELYSDLCSYGFRWRGGDAVNMSIGQGDLQMTPLQVANSFAAVANKGAIFTPHVVSRIQQADGTETPVKPSIKFNTQVSPETFSVIEDGLVRVTTGAQGTAKKYFKKVPFMVAAKTGTAEHKPKQPYAWFGAYNVQPIEGKRYVVVAMIEEGGGGSTVAAPIVEDIMNYLALSPQEQQEKWLESTQDDDSEAETQ